MGTMKHVFSAFSLFIKALGGYPKFSVFIVRYQLDICSSASLRSWLKRQIPGPTCRQTLRVSICLLDLGFLVLISASPLPPLQFSVSAEGRKASRGVCLPSPPFEEGEVIGQGEGHRQVFVASCYHALPVCLVSQQPGNCRFCEPTLMPELEEENTCMFLFHKKNFRNCSHFIALILRRNYKKQVCFSKKSSLDASEWV